MGLHEKNPRWQLVLLAVGTAGGVLLAYIDSLPRWDEAGIVASGLLLISGLLAVLAYRRPWLLALATGLWVPLRGIVVTRDLSLLLILIFPFLGAYAGFWMRAGLIKS